MASASFLVLGAWNLVSITWGGLPEVAWRSFDQALLGAAALTAGSLLASAASRTAVLAGFAAGVTLQAAEFVYRLQAGPVSDDWYESDPHKIAGPLGYANAQAGFFGLAIPITLWLTRDRRLAVRATAGAATAVLVGSLLLTQSRGGVLFAAVAILLQAAVSRDLRLLALDVIVFAEGCVLWVPLHDVDKAIVADPTTAAPTLQRYGAWLIVAAAILATVAAANPARPGPRRAIVAIAALLALAGLAFGLPRLGSTSQIRATFHDALLKTNTARLRAGETRLGSLSSSGRVDLWRVAAKAIEDRPIVGLGAGRYAAYWGANRPIDFYVLQPHSVELEVMSELGIVGAALFTVFVLLVLGGLLIRNSVPAAVKGVGTGVFAMLILQASVDWTLSFPALAAGGLVAVGACIVGRRPKASSGLETAAVLVAVAAGLAAVAPPFLAARRLAHAEAVAAKNPDEAWSIAASAHSIQPWNAAVISFQGQLAEQAGDYLRAARLYGQASRLARQPWIDEFRRARVLRSAGLRRASSSACKGAMAANPLEPSLRAGPCKDVAP
jgi:O-Antigen ligase